MKKNMVICDKCKKEAEQLVSEDGSCEYCFEAWFEARKSYWKPLYDGENLAGFLPNKDRTHLTV